MSCALLDTNVFVAHRLLSMLRHASPAARPSTPIYLIFAYATIFFFPYDKRLMLIRYACFARGKDAIDFARVRTISR